MLTQSGKTYDVFRPTQNNYDIKDIAAGLSKLCRFGGQCKEFYSVAQHSVLVSRLLPPQYQMIGLLHDASEAYMVDLPRPIKYALPDYIIAEERLLAAILAQLANHSGPLPKCVKEADDFVLIWERRDIVPECDWWAPKTPPKDHYETIYGWTPKEAEYRFLMEYRNLVKKQVA
jgi:hypothetical protein